MGKESPRERRNRDRSPERRRRSRSRSTDRYNRRDYRKDGSPRVKKEIKEEAPSDSESPRRRQEDRNEGKHGDRNNDRKDNRRDFYDRRDNRRDFDDRRERSNRDDRGGRHHDGQRDPRDNFRRPEREEQMREDGKRYGLEKKEENWGKSEEPAGPPKEKEKVNLGTSGALTEDTNTFRGVVIKYNEPPEAKKPNARWRLYPFKGDEALQVLYIHRQSAYLIGRDHKIADIPVDHPSCSKQHAVLQFRSMPFTRDDGTKARRIMPYIIDLGSGNGTYLNEKKIEAQRYIELKEKDMLKFGFSTREYVVMKEREITEEELAEGAVKHEDSD
ncbi:hypothetical protein CRE_23880 [Caenorhabditis remanei]|uniref:FHA domain-containing protein n=1 Tax=Caenorhabditis remanei TaxID=31234 RepID=E3MG88_CAERE|nr:hypothetical protein CRE_23880 [Caenorhabditis remanei]